MALISNNFLFVHIYKCAGMTVKKIFDDYYIQSEEICQAHSIAKDVKVILNDNVRYNNLFKFSFVRNPYYWMVSLYFYIRRWPAHDKHYEVKDNSFDWFIDWFEEQTKKDYELGKHKYCIMSDFLYDNDKPIVDYIGRVENFQNDMDYIMSKIDLNWITKEKIFEATNVNNIYDRCRIKRYYSNESIKKVQKIFEKDFINFNYNMEL